MEREERWKSRHREIGPVLIAKGQKRFEGFDEKIIGMYACGMTVREIRGFLLDQYRVDVGADFISTVIDALRVKIRDEGTVKNKAVYLVLGVGADGSRDVLAEGDERAAKPWSGR